jgi:hypothetical protein
MKKTALLILLTAAVLGCVWLLWKPAQPTLNAVLPPPPVEATRQTGPIMPANSAGASESETRPEAEDAGQLDQAWIEARSASIIISQTVDPVTREPNGTIQQGGAVAALGETPPVYRVQLKTSKNSILLGDKNTRHHFIRWVTVVRSERGVLELEPAISVSYPRAADLGGFLFKREENEISQIGVIIPDVKFPEGYVPMDAEAKIYIRIRDREISTEDLAGAVSQSLGPDAVLLMPTQTTPPPTTARVLWLALDDNGSFAVAHNR